MRDDRALTTGLIYHPDYAKHSLGPAHPERPERITGTIQYLSEVGLLEDPDVHLFKPEPATVEELRLVHTIQYIERIRRLSGRGGMLTLDTPVPPSTYDIARLSAGGAMLAGGVVAEGKVKNSFALIRPPGHHAGRDFGGGFCYFNNIALMVEHLRTRYRMKRFMIIDWDVHHGNGTQNIFYSDPTVLYFSTHQMPLYPGTGTIDEIGEGEGEGYNVNLPLPPGTSGEVYREIVKELIEPLADEFKPEIIAVSAGQDAYFADPIANLHFSVDEYFCITKLVMRIADRHCSGRLAMALEGGYNLEALPRIIAGILVAQSGLNLKIFEPRTTPEQKENQAIKERIMQVKAALSEYWKAFR
ncbi:histone deacetylase [Candidatus Bathyarchaeota archaeon]|nr:histone deacetylase [Candidatus Bathyarchaeota archaeon]